MTASETKMKTAAAQLTLDFSVRARPNNVVQLADHRKAPAESEADAALREGCIEAFGSEAKGNAFCDYLLGALTLAQAAEREGRDFSSGLKEFNTTKAAADIRARVKSESA